MANPDTKLLTYESRPLTKLWSEMWQLPRLAECLEIGLATLAPATHDEYERLNNWLRGIKATGKAAKDDEAFLRASDRLLDSPDMQAALFAAMAVAAEIEKIAPNRGTTPRAGTHPGSASIH